MVVVGGDRPYLLAAVLGVGAHLLQHGLAELVHAPGLDQPEQAGLLTVLALAVVTEELWGGASSNNKKKRHDATHHHMSLSSALHHPVPLSSSEASRWFGVWVVMVRTLRMA